MDERQKHSWLMSLDTHHTIYVPVLHVGPVHPGLHSHLLKVPSALGTQSPFSHLLGLHPEAGRKKISN